MDYMEIKLLEDLEFESRHGQNIFLFFKGTDRLGSPHSQPFRQYRGSFPWS